MLNPPHVGLGPVILVHWGISFGTECTGSLGWLSRKVTGPNICALCSRVVFESRSTQSESESKSLSSSPSPSPESRSSSPSPSHKSRRSSPSPSHESPCTGNTLFSSKMSLRWYLFVILTATCTCTEIQQIRKKKEVLKGISVTCMAVRYFQKTRTEKRIPTLKVYFSTTHILLTTKYFALYKSPTLVKMSAARECLINGFQWPCSVIFKTNASTYISKLFHPVEFRINSTSVCGRNHLVPETMKFSSRNVRHGRLGTCLNTLMINQYIGKKIVARVVNAALKTLKRLVLRLHS